MNLFKVAQKDHVIAGSCLGINDGSRDRVPLHNYFELLSLISISVSMELW